MRPWKPRPETTAAAHRAPAQKLASSFHNVRALATASAPPAAMAALASASVMPPSCTMATAACAFMRCCTASRRRWTAADDMQKGNQVGPLLPSRRAREGGRLQAHAPHKQAMSDGGWRTKKKRNAPPTPKRKPRVAKARKVHHATLEEDDDPWMLNARPTEGGVAPLSTSSEEDEAKPVVHTMARITPAAGSAAVTEAATEATEEEEVDLLANEPPLVPPFGSPLMPPSPESDASSAHEENHGHEVMEEMGQPRED